MSLPPSLCPELLGRDRDLKLPAGSPRTQGGGRRSLQRAQPPAAPPRVFRGWGGATVGWGSRARTGHYPGLRASAAGLRRPAQAQGERRQQNSARPAVGRVYPAARQRLAAVQPKAEARRGDTDGHATPEARLAAGRRWGALALDRKKHWARCRNAGPLRPFLVENAGARRAQRAAPQGP